MQNALLLLNSVINFVLAQTEYQKQLTIIGFGCIGVFFGLYVIDKAKFNSTVTKILAFLTVIALGVFIILSIWYK